MKYLLGMDAGGTKTLCVLADENGKVAGVGRAGCGNYQATGRAAASRELAKAVRSAIRDAKVGQADIRVAYYGISGADRDVDFERVGGILESINPAARMFFDNDTVIALRAGTKDGIGLGLISGTGTNAIGLNRRGERLQVGGWGSPYLGDYGSAHDIAATAFGLAQRGYDGRGLRTSLYDKLTGALGVKRLVDICEWDHADTSKPLNIAAYAPLVFDAASEGDQVATRILQEAGREIALAGKAVLRVLFRPTEQIPVVLAGSVFQKGANSWMIRALQREVRKEFTNVDFRVLDVEPVVGSLLAAADRLFGECPDGFKDNLVDSFRMRTDPPGPRNKKTE